MYKIAAAILFLLGVSAAQATPVAFTATGYTSSAFADVGGVSDGPNAAATPTDPLPLTSAASVVAGGGSAAANAGADAYLLSAATSAASSGDPAQASAVATFFGEFVTPGGVLALVADYLSDTGALGSTLAIQWVVDGIVLPLIGSGYYLSPDLAAGLAGTLEITLISTAAADNPGDAASNLSSVAFALNQVPEPAGAALMVLGLGLLGLRGRRSMPLAAGI